MSTKQLWNYMIVWEFHIRAGFEAQFEKVYGPEGEWARFFSLDEGYVTTELIRDRSDPRRYLTIDFWRSGVDYDRFRQRHAEEYRRIDEKCENMTEKEFALGVFERIESGR